MPQIQIEQPGVPLLTVNLTKPETGFGRADDNDVALVADEVSRHHAIIKLAGGETVLEDLKSLNGTYVNRQRVVQRVLADKDEVWFGGKCRAIFMDDPEEVKSARRQKGDSRLSRELAGIRDEMEAVTANLSMIGKVAGESTLKGETPAPIHKIEVEKMGRAFRRLDALYRASKLLASEFDLQERMENIIDLAIEITGAERGFLILREEGTDKFAASVARKMGQELSVSSPSMGIARKAAIDGEPVLMADSSADSRFGSRQSIIAQRILSAMCVPLKIEDRNLGALYVDSRQIGFNFNEEDLELFQALANQSAMAIDNVRLYERMLESEKRRASLGRFLSPGIVEMIMQQDSNLELGGQTREVTTMFCDIRSFTPMAEGMTPADLIALLNQHFTAMTEIIFRHQGTLDKYVGDEVMALFGAPFDTGADARLAIEASLEMQTKNAELNLDRIERGWPTFEIGIGVNTGEVIAGYVGSPDRMDFTVLGDHVNVASRLCSYAKAGQVIAGSLTYEHVKDLVDAECHGTPSLKGKAASVTVYHITGLKQPAGV